MRSKLLIVIAFVLALSGCTLDDPGYVSIVDAEPVSVNVVDADGNIVEIDPITRAITIIDYGHHEIHEGSSFSCWYGQLVSDIGDKTIIAFKTVNTTKWAHFVATVTSSGGAHARILEAPTITDNTGASLSITNRARNSIYNSTVFIDTSTNPDTVGQATYFTEVTMGNVSGGTEIAHMHLSAGTGKKALGGTGRGSQEWVLRQDTLYAVEIESLTNDDNFQVIELDWYEHTNKD